MELTALLTASNAAYDLPKYRWCYSGSTWKRPLKEKLKRNAGRVLRRK